MSSPPSAGAPGGPSIPRTAAASAAASATVTVSAPTGAFGGQHGASAPVNALPSSAHSTTTTAQSTQSNVTAAHPSLFASCAAFVSGAAPLPTNKLAAAPSSGRALDDTAATADKENVPPGSEHSATGPASDETSHCRLILTRMCVCLRVVCASAGCLDRFDTCRGCARSSCCAGEGDAAIC